MQKIILNDQTTFMIEAVYFWEDQLEINFTEATSLEEVSKIYNYYNNPYFSKERINRFHIFDIFTIIDEKIKKEIEEYQGEYIGYTILNSITVFNNKVKVSLQKESERGLNIERLHEKLKKQEVIITNLTSMITQDLEKEEN